MLQKLKAKEVLNRFTPLKKVLAKIANTSPNSDIDVILKKIANDEDKAVKAIALAAAVNSITWVVTYSITKHLLQVKTLKNPASLTLLILRQITSLVSYLNYYIASKLDGIRVMEYLSMAAVSVLLFTEVPETLVKKIADAISNFTSKPKQEALKETRSVLKLVRRFIKGSESKLKKKDLFEETLQELRSKYKEEQALYTRFLRSFFGTAFFYVYAEIKLLVHMLLTWLGLREYEWIISVLVSTVILMLDKGKHPFSGVVHAVEAASK